MRQFNLAEYLADSSKKIITRDGRTVRIICTDFNNKDYPIIGEIQNCMDPESFTEEGRHIGLSIDSDNDLFFVTKKHEGWVNIFKEEDFYHTFVYNSKEEAEKQGETFYNYVTTIKIEWEE